ncbi:lipid-A-disaccharide synthase [Helicobacter didelphidarum]|uniref:Lipid-A-disaccharide synthase n=1 Tax=Helicobacter didelphidarum TaxID=2040648 RepID=A0A3D8ISQ3_9HELI|nr:lipid-A-disaccharide synthase [Helicobacter didelphidarum]RDU67674.1 lipid-A-disaccharide synthase [Helicobacter didelphidarum]
MSPHPIKIFVSALEPSSNLHLRNLLKYLPNECEIIGVCDDDMGQVIFSPNDFSIMGFSDVAKKIPFLKKALKILSIEASKCHRILLMDSSSFNIRLAKLIRKSGNQIPIMYYILPQVWAWKAWRAKTIESLCDKLACIWPFELHYYTHKARFIGHPLLDIYTEENSTNYEDSNVFVFMPGSRRSEIKTLMPEYRILLKKIRQYNTNARFRIIIPERLKDTHLDVYGDLSDFELSFNTKDGLKNAHFAFVCAGTATLEAALMRIPFVLVYRTKWIDYFIARAFVQLNFVGLANIIYQAMQLEQGENIQKAGLGNDYLHEELLQHDCKADKMLESYQNFDYKRYFYGVTNLRMYLKCGSAKNVAQWLISD